MADNLQKRPSKGILKNSSSFDTQESHPQAKKNKETKWDEMNIIATLHPADKDYGHMKIDEPKTPYNYADPEEKDAIDAADLAEKIKRSVDKPPKIMADSNEESDEDTDDELTPEQKAMKRDFENKRKKHYNEFYAVKLARKLLEEEEDDEDDEEHTKKSSAGSSPRRSPDKSPQRQQQSPQHQQQSPQKQNRGYKSTQSCSKYCTPKK